jgi:hypothetical protein
MTSPQLQPSDRSASNIAVDILSFIAGACFALPLIFAAIARLG